MVENSGLYLLDIEAILDGSARKAIEEGMVPIGRVVILKDLVEYFYNQAKKGMSVGFTGLDEIKKIVNIKKGGIQIDIIDSDKKVLKELSYEEIKKEVRDYAWKSNAIIITSDLMMLESSEALNLPVLYTGSRKYGKLKIEEFFDEKTMSVHLKEGALPLAKLGKPGNWIFVKLSDKQMDRSQIEEMSREIIERASTMEEGFVEIDRPGSTIIQLKNYRIIITRPPLSDGWEITAVRPIAKLKLEDYNLPEKLMKRLLERAEGILISGSPGAGKTTFAQALAEFYSSKGKIVKTIESPRDMRLPPDVTQYSKTYANMTELHDILLLSRPDYTFFDELRDDDDFKLYVDLRLAGIGMVGVTHATTPIDAIQRIATRVELGMIPSIIDTVIFINNGSVEKVYDVEITVKLPTGLREAELARPVVEVKNFITGELEYELYTFGEQTMVIPVRKKGREGRKLGNENISEEDALTIIDKVNKIIPDAKVEIGEGSIIIRILRRSKVTARKVKAIKKIADQYNLDLKFIPLD
ncbi:ATPase (PilT family) [Caldisphaera lagunensis DSM 15908]|uniref:ATPase (PilT family) n=1 Tax=Caldisphaera lagunensis (strain DSM 15908 / JCM 11604 / ANMR 0165 / IC-154) TaxID=1056495 RepID=L0AB43_CALLD|nr:PINc/VapC family ATPase [Caldisphaera lagunensis]AFZ70629.1 ATPase (PilT family) [Caldisphaera lagunensis DSM 15908]